MAPQRARPRSHLLGGEGDTGALGATEKSVSPPSAVRDLAPPAGAPDGCAFDPNIGHNPRRPVCQERIPAHPTRSTPADAVLVLQQVETPGVLLPCLSSNNCTEEGAKPPPQALSQQQKKSACALAWNVQHMAEKFGLERLGFLTLTFADNVLSPAEAQRRFRSLRAHVLASRYVAFLRVLERQKSGRIHYHLLVVLPFDARTGVNFEAFSQGDYRTASPELRAEWSFWRRTAKAYRFGRTELMPVRSTEEGIGRYVGKYISKHHAARKPEDKGVRLVEYSRGARMARTRFGWCTEGGAEWRAKTRLFAQIMGERNGEVYADISDLRKVDLRWAYWHRDMIAALPTITAPPGYRYDGEGWLMKIATGEIVGKYQL